MKERISVLFRSLYDKAIDLRYKLMMDISSLCYVVNVLNVCKIHTQWSTLTKQICSKIIDSEKLELAYLVVKVGGDYHWSEILIKTALNSYSESYFHQNKRNKF